MTDPRVPPPGERPPTDPQLDNEMWTPTPATMFYDCQAVAARANEIAGEVATLARMTEILVEKAQQVRAARGGRPAVTEADWKMLRDMDEQGERDDAALDEIASRYPRGGRPAGEPTTKQVANAMQSAWDDFCADADGYPDCFKVTTGADGKPWMTANFRVSNFAQYVADGLRAGPSPSAPPMENTETRLRAVRDDLPWRIGWAAKNDDSEAAGRFIRLIDAIDDVLRAASPTPGRKGLRASAPPSTGEAGQP